MTHYVVFTSGAARDRLVKAMLEKARNSLRVGPDSMDKHVVFLGE